MNLFDTSEKFRKNGGGEEPPEEALHGAPARTGAGTTSTTRTWARPSSAFTRNINPKRIKPEKPPRLHDPSARTVSLELMTRDEFKPATDAEHPRRGLDPVREPQLVLPRPRRARTRSWTCRSPTTTTGTSTRCTCAARSRLPTRQDGRSRRRRRQRSTTATPRRTGGTPRSSTAPSKETAERGCAPSRTASSRSAPTAACPRTRTQPGVDLTGFNENWWFGLSCLHTLFTKEHNAICDVLKKENPRWDDQRLFDTAWLINSALMAKIHTVEWTPGIVNTPALWVAMNINWSGVLGQHVKDRFGRLGDSEIFSGIMGSPQEHHERALPADRGVRLGLPDAPADPRRLEALRATSPAQARAARTSSSSSPPRTPAPFMERLRDARPHLLDGRRAPGGDHAAQLPARAAAPRAHRRRDDGPRHARHPARPRARRAALQRLPRGDADAAGALVRRAHRPTSSGPSRSAASTTTTSTRWTCRSACTPSRCRRASASPTRPSACSS